MCLFYYGLITITIMASQCFYCFYDQTRCNQEMSRQLNLHSCKASGFPKFPSKNDNISSREYISHAFMSILWKNTFRFSIPFPPKLKLWVNVLLHYDMRGHQTHSGLYQFSWKSSDNKCEDKDKREGWGVWESGWTKGRIVINATEPQTPNHVPQLSTSSLAPLPLPPMQLTEKSKMMTSCYTHLSSFCTCVNVLEYSQL